MKEVARETKQAVGEATDDLKEAASGAQRQAKETVRAQVNARSSAMGEQVHAQAQTFQTISKQLRADGKETQAELVDKARAQLSRLGDYLDQADADTLLADVEDFARRQPLLAAVAAFGTGVLAARFLKASSGQRHARRGSR
jgi:uncharacterized protein YjbJ (UPF0337 family)